VDPLLLLQRILKKPSTADLVSLQNELLSCEEKADTAQKRSQAASALSLLGDFYHYLIGLESKLEAHAFAEIASRMDMGAVGGVVAENMLGSKEKLLERVLIGGFSEILMVLASRQYVRAFDRELEAFYQAAAWQLRTHLWHFSAARRPELSLAQRASLIEAPFTPLLDPKTPGGAKSIALGCLFQVLLLDAVAPILSPA
jgi:hypothetical protein